MSSTLEHGGACDSDERFPSGVTTDRPFSRLAVKGIGPARPREGETPSQSNRVSAFLSPICRRMMAYKAASLRDARKVVRGLLAATVVVGFLLRIWGVGFDHPFVFHPDESKYMGTALGIFLSGDPNPHFFHNSHFFVYLSLLEVFLVFVASRCLGICSSLEQFQALIEVDPWPFYLLARITTAALGAATVYLVFQVGKRAFCIRTGLAAAFMLALSFLHVRDSHFATNDVPMVFFLLLSTERMLAYLRFGKQRSAVLAALLSGIATGTKYNAAIVFIVVFAAIFLRQRRNTMAQVPRDRPIRTLAILIAQVCVAGVAGFLLTTPFALLDANAFVRGFLGQVERGTRPWWGQEAGDTVNLMVTTLHQGVGSAQLVAGCVGACLILLRRPPLSLVIALFPILYFLFFSTRQLFFARFVIPLTPFISLLAAHAIFVLTTKFTSKGPFLFFGAVGLLVLSPAYKCLILGSLLANSTDTRLQFHSWFDEHAQQGTRVMVDAYCASVFDSQNNK